jgi:hypothetical protein
MSIGYTILPIEFLTHHMLTSTNREGFLWKSRVHTKRFKLLLSSIIGSFAPFKRKPLTKYTTREANLFSPGV